MIDHNAGGDFPAIFDSTSNLTLHRRNNLQSLTLGAARRQSVTVQEQAPSDGAVKQADAVWHFVMPVGEPSPGLGDALVDDTGGRWTIIEIRELPALGRWKCKTRELSVAFGCGDRVDIQRAIWEDNGSGPVFVGWADIVTALPAKIQPVDTKVDSTVVPPATVAKFHITLSESVNMKADDRFLAEDGTIYTLQSYEQSDRIDVLPFAVVLRQNS